MRKLIARRVRQFRRFAALVSLVCGDSLPNVDALWRLSKDIDAIKLNLKFFGYELAHQLAAVLPVRTGLGAQQIALESKASTQADLESDWVAYWAAQLQVPVIFHRKLWELAYVLQALHQHGMIRAGMRGLGFGCGIEPIPSYLASHGANVTVTDLPPLDRQAKGWRQSNENTGSLARSHHAHLVGWEEFERRVKLEFVDMTAIPAHLVDYDFNWSICAFEHLGSIERGLDFVEACLETLRPGGVSVHTTEFNFMSDADTIDHGPSVYFQRKHFEALKQRLEARGHRLAPLNFDVGNKPLDRFIDLPPYEHDWSEQLPRGWGGDARHLKVTFDGIVCTCFGLVITKKPA